MTPATVLRHKFEAAVSACDQNALARDNRGAYLRRPAKLLWHAVRMGSRVWEAEHISACYIMLMLLDSVEATGGLVRDRCGLSPAIDKDWVDLGDVCEQALNFLQREAGIPTSIVTVTEETDEEET